MGVGAGAFDPPGIDPRGWVPGTRGLSPHAVGRWPLPVGRLDAGRGAPRGPVAGVDGPVAVWRAWTTFEKALALLPDACAAGEGPCPVIQGSLIRRRHDPTDDFALSETKINHPL